MKNPMNVATLCLLILSAACQKEPEGAGAREIAAVVTPVGSVGPAIYSIGTRSLPEEGLHNVAGAVPLADGLILVGDSRGLRVFGSDGTFIRQAGGVGDGPGEFNGIQWIGYCNNDSIYVADWSRADISVLDSVGTYVRRFVPRAPSADQPATFSVCNRSGTLVGWRRHRDGKRVEAGPYEASVDVFTIDAQGEPVVALGSFPGPERYRYPRNDGPRPLGRDFHLAVSDRALFLGSAVASSIQILTLAGEAIGSLAWEAPARTISAADRKRLIEDDLASATSASAEQLAERLRTWRDVEFPAAYPAYSRIMTDRPGRVWVRDYPAVGDDSVAWRVFTEDQTMAFRIRVPTSFTVHGVYGDTLLITRRDTLGVEVVEARLAVP